MKRIGFACKYMHHKQDLPKGELASIQQAFNCVSTTIKYLDSLTRKEAFRFLAQIASYNVEAFHKLVFYAGNLPRSQRMVRLSSNCLPAYTHPKYSEFYQMPEMRSFLSTGLFKVGSLARSLDVRLSMHPGQFVVLASDKPDVVDRSIEEFEYHVDIARYMGYGQKFQDFKINVHISGKQGPDGIKRAFKRLSDEARCMLTIENDEYSWGIEHSLELAGICPLVLDVHHHWCYSGQYILPDSDIHKRVVESWRGVRPVIHFSQSREDVLIGHSKDRAPNFGHVLSSGIKKARLRAHSDTYWNTALNDYALQFLETSDIMCEVKTKNLASMALHARAVELGLV